MYDVGKHADALHMWALGNMPTDDMWDTHACIFIISMHNMWDARVGILHEATCTYMTCDMHTWALNIMPMHDMWVVHALGNMPMLPYEIHMHALNNMTMPEMWNAHDCGSWTSCADFLRTMRKFNINNNNTHVFSVYVAPLPANSESLFWQGKRKLVNVTPPERKNISFLPKRTPPN